LHSFPTRRSSDLVGAFTSRIVSISFLNVVRTQGAFSAVCFCPASSSFPAMFPLSCQVPLLGIQGKECASGKEYCPITRHCSCTGSFGRRIGHREPARHHRVALGVGPRVRLCPHCA